MRVHTHIYTYRKCTRVVCVNAERYYYIFYRHQHVFARPHDTCIHLFEHAPVIRCKKEQLNCTLRVYATLLSVNRRVQNRCTLPMHLLNVRFPDFTNRAAYCSGTENQKQRNVRQVLCYSVLYVLMYIKLCISFYIIRVNWRRDAV